MVRLDSTYFIAKWTSDYKEHLSKMVEKGSIQSIAESHTTETVRFTIKMTEVTVAIQWKHFISNFIMV
jgi:hypothetical protein